MLLFFVPYIPKWAPFPISRVAALPCTWTGVVREPVRESEFMPFLESYLGKRG